MGSSGARLGSKKFLPEMRAFAVFIQDILSHGIPGHQNINPIQWCLRFGLGVLEHNALYQWQKQQREPSIEKAVLLGILLKRSGATIDVYAPLLAAADGCYSMWMERLNEQVNEDSGDRLPLGKPQKVDIDPTAEYAVDVYEKLSWKDRIAAADGLLQAIARDVRFYKMTDDLQVIQELVKESVVRRGTHAGFLAEAADVPIEWIKAIVDGRWDEVRETSRTELLLKLAYRIKDLDGKTGNCEMLAPLMSKDLVKEYIKEVKKRAKA